MRFQLHEAVANDHHDPVLFKRILFVENDQAMIDEVRDALDLHFFDVTVANTGADAVRELLRAEYDVIVCDVAMPGFPAAMFYEAVARVKPQLCKRFVSITDLGGKAGKNQKPIGAVSIWKPLEIQMLVEAIEAVLKKSHRLAMESLEEAV